MNLNSTMFSIAGIKNQLDEVRAMVYPKNDTEKRVYEALSSQNNYGASSTEMQEIAQETFEYGKFNEIMKILWTTIEDTEGRSWKQIFKALMLLDFLIKNGSERVIDVSRDKQYRLRSLQDFSFYEGPNDKGQGIRDKSKMIIELLADNDAIRSERDKAKTLRSKFVGVGNDRSGGFGGGYDSRDRDFSSSSSSSSNFSNSSNSSRDRGFGGSSSSSGGYRDNQSSSSSFGSSSYKDGPRENPKDSFQNDSSSSFSSSGSNGRYSDQDSFSSSKFKDSGDSFKNSSSAPEVALNFSKSNSASTASSASSSNKIKISIKSNDNAASKGGSKLGGTVAAAAPEIDLFGSDFTSQPAPPPVPTAAPAFDAFGSSSNSGDIFSSPPQGQQQVDPFAAAPVFNNNNNSNNFNSNAAFDPFGGSTVFQSSAVPVQNPAVAQNNNQFNNVMSNGFNNNNSNNNFNNFGGNNNNNFGNSNNFNNNNTFAPQQQFVGNPLVSAAPVNNFAQKPASSDFGEFEVAKPNNNNNNNNAVAASKPPANNFGGLVDLGSLKVEAPKASNTGGNPTAASMHLNNASHNSFAGLDGFSKTQQSMASSSTGMRPVNGNVMGGGMPMMGGGMPMGGMQQQGGYGNMMQQQPMQGMPMMGGMQQQGGYGNMQQQQPMQGMPMMGGNMMMNPQQQQMGMMGGGMQQQGGFGNINTNMGGGMQMGQQQPYRQNPNQGRGF